MDITWLFCCWKLKITCKFSNFGDFSLLTSLKSSSSLLFLLLLFPKPYQQSTWGLSNSSLFNLVFMLRLLQVIIYTPRFQWVINVTLQKFSKKKKIINLKKNIIGNLDTEARKETQVTLSWRAPKFREIV